MFDRDFIKLKMILRGEKIGFRDLKKIHNFVSSQNINFA